MGQQELAATVDAVIAKGRKDPEVGHSQEDALIWSLVYEFCPDWVLPEILRLREADFPRWYS
jgi:hypothetical protein